VWEDIKWPTYAQKLQDIVIDAVGSKALRINDRIRLFSNDYRLVTRVSRVPLFL